MKTLSKVITSFVAVTLLTTAALISSVSDLVPVHKAAAATSETVQSTTDTVASGKLTDGVTKLLNNAVQLRDAVTAGDEDKVKEYGPELEENWSKIEDDIKPVYPKLYQQVEKFLNPIVASTQASSIDKDAILNLDDQLIQVLNELSQNLTRVDQVKAGATKLFGLTNDMKAAIDAGDEAKIKEIGPKLEEVWSTFEDGVKSRDAALYAEIEKNLNPEVAGSQSTLVDKQNLASLNDNLAKAMTKLLQSL